MLSAQERIEAPVWKMGEKWTFRYDTGGEWTVEIVTEEKDYYVDSSTRIEGRLIGKYKRLYDKKTLNCVKVIKDGKESKQERDMLKKYFDFPLYTGKNWNYRYGILSSSGRPIDLVAELSAVNFEDIEVPAGKFRAIKVKNKTSVLGTSSSGMLHYWWSPDAKAAVKVEYEAGSFWGTPGYNKFELISFELK
jgi:hypothetical protein